MDRVGLAGCPVIDGVEVVRVLASGTEVVRRQLLYVSPRRVVGEVVLLAGDDEGGELARARVEQDLRAVAEEPLPLLAVLVLPRRRPQRQTGAVALSRPGSFGL